MTFSGWEIKNFEDGQTLLTGSIYFTLVGGA